jgi:hypothetical protein
VLGIVAADFCSPDSAARSMASWMECADPSPHTSGLSRSRQDRFRRLSDGEGLNREAKCGKVATSQIVFWRAE